MDPEFTLLSKQNSFSKPINKSEFWKLILSEIFYLNFHIVTADSLRRGDTQMTSNLRGKCVGGGGGRGVRQK